jgi:hypothetical protein
VCHITLISVTLNGVTQQKTVSLGDSTAMRRIAAGFDASGIRPAAVTNGARESRGLGVNQSWRLRGLRALALPGS